MRRKSLISSIAEVKNDLHKRGVITTFNVLVDSISPFGLIIGGIMWALGVYPYGVLLFLSCLIIYITNEVTLILKPEYRKAFREFLEEYSEYNKKH